MMSIMLGSSPRMRGKPQPRPSERPPPGLIPAHAGKTAARDSQSGAVEAHPRACGENHQERRANLAVTGSSPRMRGKPALANLASQSSRLIPAHAGKTFPYGNKGTGRPAHPRACGENYTISDAVKRIAGSSPRMRGKLSAARPAASNIGLIPAHAGKTKHGLRTRVFPRAHPRACGENARIRF